MLSLDMPNQRIVADRLNKFNRTWEPNGRVGGNFSNDSTKAQFMPGSRFTPQYFQYAQSGSTPSYPYYNMVDLNRINRIGGAQLESPMKGSGCGCEPKVKKGGKVSNQNLVKKLANAIEQKVDLTQLTGSSRSGGEIPFSELRDAIMPIINQAGPLVLNIAIPNLATSIARQLGVPGAGPVITRALQSAIKMFTGAGRKTGAGKQISKDLVNKLANAIEQKVDLEELSGSSRSGGNINFKKLKEAVLPVLKTIGPVILDVSIPALSTAVAAQLGVPVAGPIVGKVIRSAIKGLTGFGRKGPVKRPIPQRRPAKVSNGVAIYHGGAKKKVLT